MTEEKKQGELKKVLGLGDLMGIGIGQIIGSGIMSLTGICIAMTGAGTPVAFLLAAALVICPNIVLAVLGSAVPATGGMYTYVRDYIGKKTGFYYLALLVAGQLVLAMFAITFATYFCGLIPGMNTTVVAFCILTLCYIMNIIGVEMAARLQNILVIVLIAAMAAFIVFGMPKVNWDTFSGGGSAIMPNGWMGLLTGASLLTFATGGAEFLSELGGEMKDPGRDLPRAMIGSTVIVAVIYAFIGIVAVGVLPVDQVAGESLIQVAKAIFPTPVYVFFIVGGGMFAVASTLNATFTWCTKGLLIAAEEGRGHQPEGNTLGSADRFLHCRRCADSDGTGSDHDLASGQRCIADLCTVSDFHGISDLPEEPGGNGKVQLQGAEARPDGSDHHRIDRLCDCGDSEFQ